jgi:altronate dehydratase small subunit
MERQKAIVLHDQDDVATALTALSRGEALTVWRAGRRLDVVLEDDVPFAHKFALRALARGEEVLKYGLPIGRALEDIRPGQWVHVHNCRSERFGHRHQLYGVNA